MAIGETAYQFLKDNVTTDEKNVGHLTQKKYLEYMDQNGVTKEVLESVNNAHSELYNGLYRYNYDKMIELGDKTKEKGGDVTSLKVETRIQKPGGNIGMTTVMQQSYPIPNQPGQRTVKTMVFKLENKEARYIDKQMCEKIEQDVKARYGLD